MRTRVPIFITGFVGIFMILKFFLRDENAVLEQHGVLWVKLVANELEQWGVVNGLAVSATSKADL